jgi:hypothetical protein
MMVLIRSPYFRKMISDLRLHLNHTRRVKNLGLGTYNEQKSSWNEQRIDLELLSYVHKDFLKKYNKISNGGGGYSSVEWGRTTPSFRIFLEMEKAD